MMDFSKIGEAAGFAREVAPKLRKLRDATEGVEAIFLKDLLAQMRRTVPTSSMGQGMGAEMYRDMFDQAIATRLGKTGALGIAGLLERQMLPNALRQEWTAFQMTRDEASASTEKR